MVHDVWPAKTQKLSSAKGKGKFTFDAAIKQDTMSQSAGHVTVKCRRIQTYTESYKDSCIPSTFVSSSAKFVLATQEIKSSKIDSLIKSKLDMKVLASLLFNFFNHHALTFQHITIKLN